MEWISYIEETYREQDAEGYEILPIFANPAPIEAIVSAEARLGNQFPEDLRSLLRATNGIQESMRTDNWQGVMGYLIWPVALIESRNLFFRSFEGYQEVLKPFDNLLFFADAGNGDQFGYSLDDAETRGTEIYTWDHEDDRRICIAPSLRVFIRGWVLGEIRLGRLGERK